MCHPSLIFQIKISTFKRCPMNPFLRSQSGVTKMPLTVSITYLGSLAIKQQILLIMCVAVHPKETRQRPTLLFNRIVLKHVSNV